MSDGCVERAGNLERSRIAQRRCEGRRGLADQIGAGDTRKEGAQGMKRIILIKDKVTLASFGFAFVDFVDNQVRFPSVGCRLSHSRSTFLHSLRPPSLLPRCLPKFILPGFVFRTSLSLRRLLTLTRSNPYLTILFGTTRA